MFKPSIGTPKNNKTFICSKCKIDYFRCLKIWAHYSLIITCSNIGTPKTINFPFGANGKLMVLGVPILKHFLVFGVLITCSRAGRVIFTGCLLRFGGGFGRSVTCEAFGLTSSSNSSSSTIASVLIVCGAGKPASSVVKCSR